MKKCLLYIFFIYINLCVNAQVLNTGYTVPFNPKFPDAENKARYLICCKPILFICTIMLRVTKW